ncbi:hypothetical protein ACJJTC_017767 [Scirpophaga incertulas]
MLQIIFPLIIMVLIYSNSKATEYNTKNFYCGPYGFICEGTSKLRLCNDNTLLGPLFKCPANTVCNEDSGDICDNSINYINPETRKTLRCHRNERIPDPNVSDCKGYILCIPNQDRFQGIKFKCSGNTIFNGFTRTCTAPNRYKCPIVNMTKSVIELYKNENRKVDDASDTRNHLLESRPIECKNYKFSMTNDDGPVRAAYFCPSRPVQGEDSIRCTIFSSKYCLTLQKETDDEYVPHTGFAHRKPRTENNIKIVNY